MLHEDRFAAFSHQRRGERRRDLRLPRFTHYCRRTRDGLFTVKHKTEGKRLTRKLKALRQEIWRLMHAPLATQQNGSPPFLRGHYGYYGTPHNYHIGFYREVRRTWLRCLRRRSHKSRRMGWAEFETLTARFRLPVNSEHHSHLGEGKVVKRFYRGESARPDL